MKKYYIVLACFCLIVMGLLTGCSTTKTELSLGQYMGIEIDFKEAVVTDKDVENALINAVTANQENVEITNRAVRNGDIANIDYSGSVDGIEFEGGTSTGYDLEIGSGSFIDGFEEQIIGMKVGQTADIKVTFPDPYKNNTDLSGAEAVFTVKINSISGKVIPDKITDDMIKELTDESYTSVDDYRKYLREELEKNILATNNYNKQMAVWDVIYSNATISTLSKNKVNYYTGIYESNYQYYADMYGVNLTTFVNSYMGMTREEFDEEKKIYAEDATANYAIAATIAGEQDISISNGEYETYITENGISLDEKRQYGDSIKDSMLYDKVIEFVTSNAQINIINE